MRPKVEKGIARWLRATLAAGPVPANDVLDRALAAGFSHQALLRAKALVGVQSVRTGRRFVWMLPD